MCRTSPFIDSFLEQFPSEVMFNNEYILSQAIGYLLGVQVYVANLKDECIRIGFILKSQLCVGTFETYEELEEAIRNEV